MQTGEQLDCDSSDMEFETPRPHIYSINVEETVMDTKTKAKQKKALQLGMNPATASGRLVKDTLFRLAVSTGHKCFQCGEELTRETFSIEHMEPWLDSEDPKGNFFDQGNIAFSHLSCNRAAARPRPRTATRAEAQATFRGRLGKTEQARRRKEQYQRTGT
jgi:hypothetical protein